MPITNEAHRKLWEERTSPTGKRLFFQLLHEGKRLKCHPQKASILYGMFRLMKVNREDFTIADQQRDVWKQGGVFE